MNAVIIFICEQVIPFSRGSAWEQPPPDLASYLYKNRIVYLGMSLVPSVTELILAEFLYLQYEDADKPIYLYVNSTGTTKVKTFPYTLQLASETFLGYSFCMSTMEIQKHTCVYLISSLVVSLSLFILFLLIKLSTILYK